MSHFHVVIATQFADGTDGTETVPIPFEREQAAEMVLMLGLELSMTQVPDAVPTFGTESFSIVSKMAGVRTDITIAECEGEVISLADLN